MPNVELQKRNNKREELLVDGEGIGFIIQADTGLWHLSGKGTDEIELEAKLSDGSTFSGGTHSDASNALLVDYLFA